MFTLFLLLLHNGDLLPPRQGLRRVRGQLGGGAGDRAQDLVLLHSPARRELFPHGRDDSGIILTQMIFGEVDDELVSILLNFRKPSVAEQRKH